MRQELTVAIATLSGSVYYKLAQELKKRKMGFVSLDPNSEIPPYINLILTTKEERCLLDHPNIFVYNEGEDATGFIDRTIQTVYRTGKVRRITIGVDPGKNWGISATADGRLLYSGGYGSMKGVEQEVQRLVTVVVAEEYVVKIGNGSEPYHSQIISRLDESLPKDVVMESVREEGTSRGILWRKREEQADAASAGRICFRRGRRIPRKNRAKPDE
jgi:hypothetical protein